MIITICSLQYYKHNNAEEVLAIGRKSWVLLMQRKMSGPSIIAR